MPCLYAPAYYSRFRCIADRCRHSCCVDWEIDIDEETLAAYRAIPSIMETITEDKDGASFVLCRDGRCPHLNDAGLCRIILSHGEDALCEICRRHPRFFNDPGGGRTEVGLGMVCEEACRLILEDEEPFRLIRVEDTADTETEPTDFDPMPMRDEILQKILAHKGNFNDMADDLQTAFAIPALYTADEWIRRFRSLEILDDAWERTLCAAQGQPVCGEDMAAFDPYFARLLTYFVFRHVSAADSPRNLRARLGFALLSCRVIRRLFFCQTDRSKETLFDLARRYSAEIEYSEDNTDELIFAFECAL